MYSRYQDNSRRPVRLPEHYGGSAFLQSPTEPVTVSKREAARTFSKDSVEEKASPIADRMLRAEASEETVDNALPVLSEASVEEKITEEKEKSITSSPEKKPPTLGVNFEGLRRLLGGGEGDGEQDRLLLLGLILLLSRTNGDSDILLWLSLLLLCG